MHVVNIWTKYDLEDGKAHSSQYSVVEVGESDSVVVQNIYLDTKDSFRYEKFRIQSSRPESQGTPQVSQKHRNESKISSAKSTDVKDGESQLCGIGVPGVQLPPQGRICLTGSSGKSLLLPCKPQAPLGPRVLPPQTSIIETDVCVTNSLSVFFFSLSISNVTVSFSVSKSFLILFFFKF
jgi:hypothetical protein